jgi:hypothetical protein
MKQRWYLKWLWLKHSYPFRWAHKPLCDRFEHDVVQVGKMHLCRSCTCVYLTLLIALIAGWMSQGTANTLTQPLIITLGFGIVLIGSFPKWYKQWPRWTRELLRGGMGLCLAMILLCLLHGQFVLSLSLSLMLFGFWRHYLIKRAGRRSTCCDGCSELGKGICSGYHLQAEGARSYEISATDWLMKSGEARLPNGPVLR